MTKLARKMALMVLLASSFLFCIPAKAVVISPVIIDHSIQPGRAVTGKISITNDRDVPAVYYVSMQRFVAEGEEGDQKYLPETDIAGLPSWFTFSEKSFIIQPKKTKDFVYTISAPLNAEPGGHYATVFFSTSPEVQGQASGVGVTAKTGVVFLIKIAGDVKENANIESFTVNQGVFSHLPALMSLRIRNTGNVHFRPSGTLTVRNMWGGIAAKVQANPRNSAVLPNSIRRLDTWWVKNDQIEQGGFFAQLKNEWKNFAFGRYSATVDVKYGSLNTPLESRSVVFWVFPWRITLIFILCLGIIFALLRLYNKLIIRAALKKSK